MPKTRNIGVCIAPGCNKPERSVGYCANHYAIVRKRNTPEYLVRDRTTNPYYHLWIERKTRGILAPEWLNFYCFTQDIGMKPPGYYFLVRPNKKEPYGPNNFVWQEKLKRVEGESDKDWHARKWKSRHVKTPGFEQKRRPGRRFGFTIGQYDMLLAEQGGVCAICKEQEIAVFHKTGKVKRFSIDHCHATNKIRQLLCARCYLTIGKVKESIPLLEAMIEYLKKHSKP